MSEESPITKSYAKIYEALLKAQGEFPVIPKDSKVDVYSKPPERKFLYTYKYADLTTIIACTRPSLSKHGIGFTQSISKDPDMGVGMITRFLHSSGESFDAGFVPFTIPSNSDMKHVGGLYTYAKRISLTAALGVSADEDIDAANIEASQGNTTLKSDIPKPKPKQPIKNHAPKPKPDPIPMPDSNDFDEHMSDDPQPEYFDQTPPVQRTPIQELRHLVDFLGISPEEATMMIKKSTGRAARSVDLSEDELIKVIRYINLKK